MQNDFSQIVEYITCSCGSEAIQISRFSDETDVYLSIFQWRRPGGPTLLDRLRHAWKIIRRGYPGEDDIILSQDEARQFAKKLVEFSTPTGE